MQRGCLITCMCYNEKSVTEFLNWFESGLSYRAMNTAWSALSVFMKAGVTIGNCQAVKQLMKGVLEATV